MATRPVCKWNSIKPNEDCSRTALPQIDFCDQCVDKLVSRALAAKNSDARSFGTMYLRNFTVFILGAAGTATARFVVENWEHLWSVLANGSMFPPGLCVFDLPSDRPGHFIGRFNDEEEINPTPMGYFCEPLDPGRVLESVLDAIAFAIEGGRHDGETSA